MYKIFDKKVLISGNHSKTFCDLLETTLRTIERCQGDVNALTHAIKLRNDDIFETVKFMHTFIRTFPFSVQETSYEKHVVFNIIVNELEEFLQIFKHLRMPTKLEWQKTVTESMNCLEVSSFCGAGGDSNVCFYVFDRATAMINQNKLFGTASTAGFINITYSMV